MPSIAADYSEKKEMDCKQATPTEASRANDVSVVCASRLFYASRWSSAIVSCLFALTACTTRIVGSIGCEGVTCLPDQPPAPELPSYVNVRVTYPYSAASYDAGSLLPRVIAERLGAIQGGVYRRKVDPDDAHCAPFVFSKLSATKLRMMLPLEVRITGPVLGCGNNKRSDQHTLIDTWIDVQPIFDRKNWGISIDQLSADLQIVEGECSAARVPLNEIIKRLAEFFGSVELYKKLQAFQASTNLRSSAERGWSELQKPRDLGDGSWLLLRPVAWGLTDPVIGDSGVEVIASAQVRPIVGVGVKPTNEINPMPELQPKLPGQGFNLVLPVEVAFQRLKDAGKGLHFDLGGHDVEIVATTAVNAGDKVALVVKLVGDYIDIDAVFEGHPKIADKHPYAVGEKGTFVYFADLDMTADTHSRLVAWLGNTFAKDAIVAGLKQHSVIPIGSVLETLRTKINSKLTEPLVAGVSLAAHVDDLSIERLDLGVGKIIGWVKLAGATDLRVEVPPRRRHLCVPFPGAAASWDEF